jgi:hypothetical protein
MAGASPQPRAFHCPSKDEILAAAIALLPRGRAWQTHETGPLPGFEVAFDPGGFETDAFQTARRPRSILWEFFASVSDVFAYLTERICALRLEFWCASQSETRDQWLIEYGLPNACDPYPDLCTKVAAIGGTRCEFYTEVAARAGWSISCVDTVAYCGTRVGSRRSKAGIMKPGRIRTAQLVVLVDLKNSPAFTGTTHARPKAGRLKAGRRLACGPDISPLECILARVVHAELQINYEVF